MSVLAPERPKVTLGNGQLDLNPVGALEQLDGELAFVFDYCNPYNSCCITSTTSNGSDCCASKTLSTDLCCQAPEK